MPLPSHLSHHLSLPLPPLPSLQLKVYRFDLQKAVNTPINSISVQSASHIKDKVQRLCNLLDGRPVEVVGKRVSTATHPQAPALDYCRSLFAKKIVVSLFGGSADGDAELK